MRVRESPATARATGLPVNPQVVHVWTFEDGKVARAALRRRHGVVR